MPSYYKLIIPAGQLLNEMEHLGGFPHFFLTGQDHPSLISERFLFDLQLSLRFGHDWGDLRLQLPIIYKILTIIQHASSSSTLENNPTSMQTAKVTSLVDDSIMVEEEFKEDSLQGVDESATSSSPKQIISI